MWSKGFIFVVLLFAWVRADEEVQVTIPQGTLKGLKLNSAYQNVPYYSFKGIPYAKPNVGRDKFKAPEPAGAWDGVYDATEHRSTCTFFCIIKQDIIGSEDCLYLNVYTPTADQNARKAVMVFLHPGGWKGGSGNSDLFGPDFLVENDVVVVTLNSRLDAIGFLNTGDANAPGNVGMKDQVMALKWVKDNIHAFGGCPNRVTIFGSCSGGASVQYHMVSPMSEGLFKGAIGQSGSALDPPSITYNSKELAFKLGEALGIQTTDTGELIDKLKDIPARELIIASGEVTKSLNPLNGGMFAFVPSVEPDVGQEIFLPADNWELLKSGRVMDVPIMIGGNLNEASMFAEMLGPFAEQMNDHPEVFVPDALNITDLNQKKKVGESIKSFYFGNKKISRDTFQGEYQTMLNDLLVFHGIFMSTKILNKRNSAPIYEYLFTYDSPYGLFKNLFKVGTGVAQGDELGYIFNINFLKTLPEPGSPAEKMTRIMSKMWTNFAKDGDPTSSLDDYVNVKWEPKGDDDNYMNINQDLKMEKGLFKDRADFWMELYKDNLGSFA